MEDDEKTHWYVMRDLKRANASLPAYKLLEKEKIEVFTPMKTILIVKQGRRVRKKIPFIQDLLFVHDKRSRLDSIVGKTPTLQYLIWSVLSLRSALRNLQGIIRRKK